MKHINAVMISTFIFSASFAQAEGGSVHHSVQASKHSALAVAHGVTTTAKTASAVAAVPLVLAGGASLMIGSASLEAGASAIKSVKKQGPLIISETTVTADPAPNQVIVIQNTIKTKSKD